MSLFFLKNKEEKCQHLIKKANKFYAEKNFLKAIKIYKKILKFDSHHFAAAANIAVSYFECEKYDDAIPYFNKVISLDSSNAWWHNYLSQIHLKKGDFDSSLSEAWQAILCDEKDTSHHLNLAYTIYEIFDCCGRDKTDEMLKKWHSEYPENPIAKQCYNSYFYNKNFAVSEPEYVEELFDVFASDFDDILVELQYDSPKFIAQYLAKFFQDKTSEKLNILDLGCGSGLCGKEIKKLIKNSQITGVDISAKMLEKAQEKNVYDKLIKSDITVCFSKIKSECNAVVSSDVFTYFGKLDSVFSEVGNLLKEKGVFVFTFSSNSQNEKDYFLMPSSRFVHSLKYVENLLKKNKFVIVKKEEKVLRKEGEKDVVGYVILAQKT